MTLYGANRNGNILATWIPLASLALWANRFYISFSNRPTDRHPSFFGATNYASFSHLSNSSTKDVKVDSYFNISCVIGTLPTLTLRTKTKFPLFFVLILVFRRYVLTKNISILSWATWKYFVKALDFWKTTFNLTKNKEKEKAYIADKPRTHKPTGIPNISPTKRFSGRFNKIWTLKRKTKKKTSLFFVCFQLNVSFNLYVSLIWLTR